MSLPINGMRVGALTLNQTNITSQSECFALINTRCLVSNYRVAALMNGEAQQKAVRRNG